MIYAAIWVLPSRLHVVTVSNKNRLILHANTFPRFLASNIVQWMFLAIVVILPLCARATVWSADNLVMVHLQNRNRYVCDPDGVLTPSLRDTADTYLRRLHVECGIQTVFVVVRHVKDGDTFRMAQDIGNKYGVGDKKSRRGMVVVVAVDDRRYTLAPGMGLEADLTDVECDDIARACIVKNMKVNQTDAMATETVRALYNKFKTGQTGVPAIDNTDDLSSDDALLALMVLLLFLGWPTWQLIKLMLISLGLMKKPAETRKKHHRHNDDDWFPPFFFGGGFGGGSGGGSIGGSFGGGSFGGGGSSGGW